MRTLSYLHFTDLHLGLASQRWLMSTFREQFYADLRKLSERSGPWDVVLFSGDLVQSGQKEEFERLNDELVRLWKLFRQIGCTPVLITVPGNHDLVRPVATRAAVRILQGWHKDELVRDAFWDDPSSEYRQIVTEAFANYQSWLDNTPLPVVHPEYPGLLPGDGAATLECRGIKIGIVGLNSTFLQLTGDDYEGRLDIHPEQLYAVTNYNPAEWCDRTDVCILMTHHPHSWLHVRAQEQFRSEVYPPGRFFAHFCGHLHAPMARDVSEGGAEPRRLRQGASLFGLEKWGTTEENRVHGYSAGIIEIDRSGGTERFWPRIAFPTYAGNNQIVADPRCVFTDNDSVITSFRVKPELVEPVVDEGEAEPDERLGTVSKNQPTGMRSDPLDNTQSGLKRMHRHPGDGFIVHDASAPIGVSDTRQGRPKIISGRATQAGRVLGGQPSQEPSKKEEADTIFLSPHPTTLRVGLGLMCIYWLLTGPLPLLELCIREGFSWDRCWTTATSVSHLYLHSTCLGLFVTLCLLHPLGAMFATPVFRGTMCISIFVLLFLAIAFIVNDVRIGPEIYGSNPIHLWLVLSSALQMLVFMISAMVIMLTAFGTITHLSTRTADIKVSNRLFGTILYGILWLPMRSAYETQARPNARELLQTNNQLRLWIVIFTFIIGLVLLACGVFYKQRRYLVPIFVVATTAMILWVSLLRPLWCEHLFKKGGDLSTYLFVFGFGLACYFCMTLYESTR